MCDSPTPLESQSERIVFKGHDDDVPGSPRSASVRLPAKPCLSVITDLQEECSTPARGSHSPTARATSLKAQFVEVYLGSAEFKASKLNAIIAINLQASDRLYEVVVVNDANEEEIGRVYVYESELKLQMDARRKALSAIANVNTDAGNSMAAVLAAQLAAAELGPNTSLANRARRISATQKQRRSSLQLATSNNSPDTPTRKGSAPHLVPAQGGGDTVRRSSLPALLMARAAAQKFMDIKCNKNDQIKDGELQKIMDYNNNPMKDSPLLNAPRPIDEPQSYFDLDMSTNIDPEMEGFKKYEKEAMERDQSLISADISSATADSIRFYTAVILSSLSVRRKAMIENSGGKRPFQFVLYDGCTKDVFSYFFSLPPSCLRNTVPTTTGGKDLKNRADYNMKMKSDLDVKKNVHDFVECANGHEGQAKSEIASIGIKKRYLTDNLNPNRKRYRYMWQAAYNAVIAKIRRQKSVRSQWACVIAKHKEQTSHEQNLLEQSKIGKFRQLAVKTGGRNDRFLPVTGDEVIEGSSDDEDDFDDSFTPADMSNYSNCMSVKKRRKSYLKCINAADLAQK